MPLGRARTKAKARARVASTEEAHTLHEIAKATSEDSIRAMGRYKRNGNLHPPKARCKLRSAVALQANRP